MWRPGDCMTIASVATGLTHRKLSVIAEQQRASDLAAFTLNLDGLCVDQLVWIDESHVNDRNAQRAWGRGFRGQRLRRRGIYVRGQRLSLIGK